MENHLLDFSSEHQDALRHGYESGGHLENGRKFRYHNNQLIELKQIKLCSPDDDEPGIHTYKSGCYALVNVTTKPGQLRGEAHAYSVAKILGIFEDKHGHCYVALHYFWRWGQIHATYDLHPATRPASRHQIFLQKEVLQWPIDVYGENLRTPVRYASSGKFVELVAASDLIRPAIVQHRTVAERYEGGLAGYEALYRGRTDSWDEDTDTPNTGFWFDSTFDHSCYAFEQCDGDSESDPDRFGAPVISNKQIPRDQLTLLDAFCGCGTVSVAANTAGISVVGGIDSHRDAISSYRANTCSTEGGKFNPSTNWQPMAMHMPMHESVAKIRSKQLKLPDVTVLHASPPCQNVSQKKKKESRVISGAEALAVVELVQLLKPAYVTLEEVPGFTRQRFLKSNLVGPLAGWPDQSPPPPAAAAANIPVPDEGIGDEGEEEDDTVTETEDDDSTEAREAAAAAAAANADEVVFSMLQIVVPPLLSMGYTVRVGLVLASDLGVPQERWRLVLVATLCGYKPAMLPTPKCERPMGKHKARHQIGLPVDPNFCLRDGVPASWNVALEVVAAPGTDATLAPYTTVAEAIGDLPPLLSGVPSDTRLGYEVADYDTNAAAFRCPLPVDSLEGCEPCSSYSLYSRNPHTPQQSARLWNSFNRNQLLDHMVEHSSPAIANLLRMREDKPGPGEAQETEAEEKARKKAGRRTAADGLAASVLGHNEPRKKSMHFTEDRMHSILERRRFQSLPDWLVVRGDHKSRQQQIGNAVPYLLALALMGEVYAAATGEEPYMPPWPLHGPDLEGSGMPAAATAAQQQIYKQWVQQVDTEEQQRDAQGGWTNALEACRELLITKAAGINQQQRQQYQELRLLVMEERLSQQQQTSQQPHQQQGKRAAAGASKAPGHQQQQHQTPQQHQTLQQQQHRKRSAAGSSKAAAGQQQQQQHPSEGLDTQKGRLAAAEAEPSRKRRKKKQQQSGQIADGGTGGQATATPAATVGVRNHAELLLQGVFAS